jgi:hypothetical protein
MPGSNILVDYLGFLDNGGLGDAGHIQFSPFVRP